jgi:hypothetical protein
MSDWAEQYKVDVPEGHSGAWRIEKFTVSKEEEDFERIRGIFSQRYTRQGTYTRLMRNGAVIMSDTHDEIQDHKEAIRIGAYNGSGIFLINGLGIGMVADNILKRNPAIRDSNKTPVSACFSGVSGVLLELLRVRVIEISQDVISLVAPHYRVKYGDRFEVIFADALAYMPPKGEWYAGVWHDIWDSICSDNLEQMKVLHRKYGRRTAWQRSWCRVQCERQRYRYAS